MKTLFFALFCAFVTLSFARPQQSYEKNGPAKLYKSDGGDGDDGYGTGGFKLDGDDGDDGYGTGGIKLDGDDDGGYGTGDGDGGDGSVKNGDPIAVTGPAKYFQSAGKNDGKDDNGEPVAVTGEPDGYKVAGKDDGKSDNGEPVAATGAPDGSKDSGDDGKSDVGEPVAATEQSEIVHLRTSYIASNAYRVSSPIARKQRNGKSVAHASRNGPHRLVSRK
uniref:Cell surface protein n=1 Tax=Caenorhabditis tropicalis TaxID=1561998 RepID=A0A1I7UMR5_9PELO